MKAKSLRWFDRSYGRLLRPFETNPFEDRIAALLVTTGWVLMAAPFSGSACVAYRTMAKAVRFGTAPMTCPLSSLPSGPAF